MQIREGLDYDHMLDTRHRGDTQIRVPVYIGLGPANGQTQHESLHGKHMRLAGAVSARHIDKYVPSHRQAVSCHQGILYVSKQFAKRGFVLILSS